MSSNFIKQMTIRSSRIQSGGMQLSRTFFWKNISVNEQQYFECSTIHLTEDIPRYLKSKEYETLQGGQQVSSAHCEDQSVSSVNSLVWSGSPSVTQDHSDVVVSRKPMIESFVGKDLSHPFLHPKCVTSHLGSLILIRIIPMELILILVITMFLSIYKYTTKPNKEDWVINPAVAYGCYFWMRDHHFKAIGVLALVGI